MNGEGKLDVLAEADTQAVAFTLPDWQPVVLHDSSGGRLLHATVLDCNRDGRLDFVVARIYSPWMDYRKARAMALCRLEFTPVRLFFLPLSVFESAIRVP